MRLGIFIAACLITGPAMASEFVAVVHVEQLTLSPYGSKHCPAACPIGYNAKKHVVCISNECGCGVAEIVIDHVLIGQRTPRVNIKYTLGEWCKLRFPLADPRVLIRLTDSGAPEWSQLLQLHVGYDVFDTTRFTRIGSVEVSTLKSKGGWASLRDLEQRLGP